ncbi:MAG: bifunctional glutamate N-acetyltransferase/amino-acid acetyltransferase ArgJ [Oscillospiraceae bacterium]|nr:bifunctional glutamate N-acetyltransferase/amino-acid acetyltransferase ArgJ [Oscillospiraceae bacterium]
MKFIEGGVCAAKGFKAAGIHCGVKANSGDKKDLALIYSDYPCSANAVYTKNKVKAAPLHVTREHLADGRARAVIANSGNANACAPMGMENAAEMCSAAAEALGIEAGDMIVASTGVIGQTLRIEAIKKGMPDVVKALSDSGSTDAAKAIMTTDTQRKEFAVEFELDGKTARMGGIAKGSGMIHPNMGTMLCFITTDAAISSDMIKKALLECVRVSFNRVSVDGDTSTNDFCAVLANGLAGNSEICAEGPAYETFLSALKELCIRFARAMAADGEGATHLINCTVSGALDEDTAELMAMSVIASPLVKTAMFGADANWGRVLAALGYSGAEFEPGEAAVSFSSSAGDIPVCEKGMGLPFDEDLAKKILSEPEISINAVVGNGPGRCTCWGCDLSYDYVKINGDYRT